MKTEADYPLYLKARHIAEILGISTRTAYNIMSYKGFPLTKAGGSVRAKREDFFKWLSDQTQSI